MREKIYVNLADLWQKWSYQKLVRVHHFSLPKSVAGTDFGCLQFVNSSFSIVYAIECLYMYIKYQSTKHGYVMHDHF